MAERIAPGTLVEIHRCVLQAGERAPQVPDDTQQVPLEMRVKGFLSAPAAPGEEAVIIDAPPGATALLDVLASHQLVPAAILVPSVVGLFGGAAIHARTENRRAAIERFERPDAAREQIQSRGLRDPVDLEGGVEGEGLVDLDGRRAAGDRAELDVALEGAEYTLLRSAGFSAGWGSARNTTCSDRDRSTRDRRACRSDRWRTAPRADKPPGTSLR